MATCFERLADCSPREHVSIPDRHHMELWHEPAFSVILPLSSPDPNPPSVVLRRRLPRPRICGSTFAYASGAGYEPHPSQAGTAAKFRAVLDAHGMTHGLLVGAGPYSPDNRCMLDAIAGSGGRFKGIALVTPAISERELAALAGQGVVGIRINIMNHGMRPLTEPGADRLLARMKEQRSRRTPCRIACGGRTGCSFAWTSGWTTVPYSRASRAGCSMMRTGRRCFGRIRSGFSDSGRDEGRRASPQRTLISTRRLRGSATPAAV
jgi:Amidohydrolase